MICVQQWRLCIGTFVVKCKKKKSSVSVLVVSGRSVHSAILSVCLFSFLMICGDVESNPGPKNNASTTTTRSKQPTLPASFQDVSSPATPTTPSSSVDPTSLSDIMLAITGLTKRFDNFESRITSIETTLSDIKTQQQDVQTKVTTLSDTNTTLVNENRDMKATICSLEGKIDNLEGQSRRSNLIFHGVVPEKENETWEDCEVTVGKIIKEELGIEENISFERVHRLQSPRNPRPIIAKFSNFKTKTAVLREKKKLQNTTIYMTEDYTPRVRGLRQRLAQDLTKLRAEGRRVSMVFDHLIVDGVRYDWDPVTATAKPAHTSRPARNLHSGTSSAPDVGQH